MAFIKLIAKTGKKVIINTDNVTAFYDMGNETTYVCFVDPNDYITVPMNIEELTEKLTTGDRGICIHDISTQD